MSTTLYSGAQYSYVAPYADPLKPFNYPTVSTLEPTYIPQLWDNGPIHLYTPGLDPVAPYSILTPTQITLPVNPNTHTALAPDIQKKKGGLALGLGILALVAAMALGSKKKGAK